MGAKEIKVQHERGYAYRIARRTLYRLQRQLVAATVRFHALRLAWLRAAEVPSRVQLRKELFRLRVFPETVTVTLGSPGNPHFKMIVGSPWDQIAAQMWWDDAYGWESPTSALVAALARRSERAVVVGANTGFYCLMLGLEPGGPRVDAVEPWAPAIERLRQNLELNNVADRVVVWPVAAGPEEGTMTLYVPQPLAENWPFETSASLSATYRRRHEDAFEVPVTTVDAIRQTDPAAVGMILVDAEGFDYEVLRGADRTVSLDGPIIFTEVTSEEVDSMNVLLAQWGYIAVELEPSGLWVRDRVIRPVHNFQHLAESTAGALWWNSALLPPSRLSDLAAAAAECSLPLYGHSDLAVP